MRSSLCALVLLTPLRGWAASCPEEVVIKPIAAARYDAVVVPYVQAQRKIATGFVEEGIGLLRKLTAAQPTFALAHRALALAYAQRASAVQAYTSYSHALDCDDLASADRAVAAEQLKRLAPKHAALGHYEKAAQFYAQRQYREAVEWALLAVQAKPELGLAHRLACLSYARLAATGKAIDACREYVSLDPSAPDAARFADISYRWGTPVSIEVQQGLDSVALLLLNDKPLAAIDHIRQLLQHSPTVAPLYRLLGRAALQSGNVPLALDGYRSFLRFGVDDAGKKTVQRLVDDMSEGMQ